MADFEVVRVLLNNSTGNQDITISGFGTPAGAMCFGCQTTSIDSNVANAVLMVGLTDFTNEVVTTTSSEDSIRPTSSVRLMDNTHFGAAIGSTGVIAASFTIVGTITDGIRINIDVADANQRYVTFVLIKNCDVAVGGLALSEVSTTNSVTGLGFEPDLVFGTCIGDATYRTTGTTNALNSLGWALNDGSETNRSSFISFRAGSSSGATATDRYYSETYWAGQLFNGVLTWLAEVTAFDADGFTVTTNTTSTGGDIIPYMAIKFDNAKNIALYTANPSTSTGDQTFSTPNFEPEFDMFITSDTTAIATLQTADPALGVYVANDETGYTHAMSIESQFNPDTNRISATGAGTVSGGQNIGWIGTPQVYDSTGPVINWTTVGSGTRHWIGLAIGPAGGGPTNQNIDVGLIVSTSNVNNAEVISSEFLAMLLVNSEQAIYNFSLDYRYELDIDFIVGTSLIYNPSIIESSPTIDVPTIQSEFDVYLFVINSSFILNVDAPIKASSTFSPRIFVEGNNNEKAYYSILGYNFISTYKNLQGYNYD